MKMTLIAATAFAAAAMAGAPQASAKDSYYGLTIGGPNGYLQIGTKSGKYGYGYDVPHGGRDRARPYDWQMPRCLGPRQIQRRLRRHGWRDFHVVDVRKHALIVKAKRRGGPRFRLKIDRCNGVILKAKLIGGRHHFKHRYNDDDDGRRGKHRYNDDDDRRRGKHRNDDDDDRRGRGRS